MAKMRLISDAIGSVEGFCLVKSAAVRTDSKGSDYLDLVIADSDGECPAKMWNYNRVTHGTYDAGDVIKVRGTVQVWKDAEQFKIDRIRPVTPADELDMSLLVPCAPIAPETAFDKLMAEVDRFTDEDYKRLVKYLYRENRDALLLYPAGVKLHHATRGGLLHHTLSVVELCKSICALYPSLDSDLLLSGAMLHDIGKTVELDTNSLGIAGAYTAMGQLVGHINIGVAMIHAAAEVTMLPQKKTMLVSHMLLSHHGKPEFGSPKLPAFPEAEVLATCDLLDSKLYEMNAALDGVLPDGFSERQWALDNRQLYKI